MLEEQRITIHWVVDKAARGGETVLKHLEYTVYSTN